MLEHSLDELAYALGVQRGEAYDLSALVQRAQTLRLALSRAAVALADVTAQHDCCADREDVAEALELAAKLVPQ